VWALALLAVVGWSPEIERDWQVGRRNLPYQVLYRKIRHPWPHKKLAASAYTKKQRIACLQKQEILEDSFECDK